MSEPTLNDISDYNTLEGEKKRVVWAVIIAGIILGVIYVAAMKIYNNSEDDIVTNDIITKVPSSKCIPVR